MNERPNYLELMKNAFNNMNNLERRNAEKQLIELCSEDMFSIQTLLDIILDTSQEQTIQAFAAILMTQAVGKFEKQDGYLNSDTMCKHVNVLKMALLSPQLNIKFKSHINVALGKLNSLRGAEIRINMNDLKEQTQTINLQGNCYRMLQEKDLNSIQGGLQILKYISEQLEKETNFDYMESYVSLGSYVVGQLILQDKNIIKQSQKELQQLSRTLYKLWAQISVQICEKAFERKNEKMKQLSDYLISNHLFIKSLCDILMYQRRQSQNPLISSGSMNRSIDSQINDAKGYAFASLNQLGIWDFPQKSILLSLSLKTLANFSASKQFDIKKSITSAHLKILIVEILYFISHCLTDNALYSSFVSKEINLMIDIIMPLLISQEPDTLTILNDPQEYIQSSLDLFYYQKSKDHRVQIAKLIVNFTRYIDGAYTHILQLCKLVMQYSIQMTKDPNSSTLLPQELRQSMLISEYSDLQRMNVSILVLTVCAVHLKDRKDMIDFLVEIGSDLLILSVQPTLDPLINSRIILYQGVLCQSILSASNKEDLVEKQISIMIGNVKNSFQQEKYFELSLSLLFQVIKNPLLVKILEPYLQDMILVTIESFLISRKLMVQFEILKKIIKLYQRKLNQTPFLLDQILSILEQNLLIDQCNLTEGGKSQSQFQILKTIQIIRSLIQENQYPIEGKVESLLDQIYQMLRKTQNLEYYDDILSLMSIHIEKCQKVTQSQISLIEVFPSILISQDQKLGVLFEVYVNMIIHGARDIFCDLRLQQLVIGSVYRSIVSNIDEVDIGESLLLLQLIIQELLITIPSDSLHQIFDMILKKSRDTIKFTFTKSRLIGVILSGFLFDFDRTRIILEACQSLDHILTTIIQYQCEPGYDTKLYILTLCNLIRLAPNLTQQLFPPLLIALRFQINHEDYIQNKIRGQLKDPESENEESNQNNEDNPYGFKYSGEQINSQDQKDLVDVNFDESKYKAQRSMDVFQSRILNYDEFEVFRQLIALNNPHLQLQQVQFQIVDILQFKRIRNEDGWFHARKIIKTKRRKEMH